MQPINNRPIDRFFLFSVVVLTLVGIVVFLSASLGLLAENSSQFINVALKQLISLVIGVVFFFALSKIRYANIRKAAFIVLLGAIAMNLLLFIPGISLFYGGATRWIDLGVFSFQPSEFLKIAFIIYFAAWAHFAKDRIKRFKYGLLPYLILMSGLAALLFFQRDMDTLLVIGFTGLVMLMIAGLPIKHLFLVIPCAILIIGTAIWVRPDAMTRIKTFLDPQADTQGAGYQINQSLIAIGSGQLTGRGFGQSVQKFGYLPEPIGDSIFAVAAEEFGFVGGVILLALYLCLAISAFRVGTRAPDIFGGMLAIGIAVLIVSESFMNIGAMLGIIPLSGQPLLFISHGGTALVIALAASGIVANVSKYAK